MKKHTYCIATTCLVFLVLAGSLLPGCYTRLTHPQLPDDGGEYYGESDRTAGKTCLDCHGSDYYHYHFPYYRRYSHFGYHGYYYDDPWYWYYYRPWWWDYDRDDDDDHVPPPSYPKRPFLGDRSGPDWGSGGGTSMGPPIGDGDPGGGEDPQDEKQPKIRGEGVKEMKKKDLKPARSELKNLKTRLNPSPGEGEINKPETQKSDDLFSEDEENTPAEKQRKGGSQ